MKTLKELNLKDKKILVRCDFNVPLSNEGLILNDFRIRETLPTIEYLIKEKAKIILMSHLGRPKGEIIESLRLTSVYKKLKEYLNVSIIKTNDCLGRDVENAISQMKEGQVVLLENIQFNPGETENNPEFAKALAGLADIFIMEAFGQAHRNYASITGIPKYLPSAAGFLLEKEINSLNRIINNPQKPLIAIIGGAKVETKTVLINKISEIADFVLIGGLIKKEIRGGEIKLEYPEKIIGQVEPLEGEFEKDIGPETVKIFKEKIKSAKTVFFNGVLGQIEKKEFQKGTKEILEAIIKSKAFSVIGGGEMVEFTDLLGITSKFNHVSTGGGAMLAFLSGEKLPGIEAIK